MDKSLYEIMQEILEEKKTDFTEDIRFLGTLTSDEVTQTGDVAVTRDVFVMIDKMPDGTIVEKFYDEDKNFIAGRDKDGKIYPSAEFAQEDLSFMAQLEDLSQAQGLSLSDLDNKLERVAKALGVKKEDILAMSETDLSQKIAKKGMPQIELGDENSEQESLDNSNVLDNVASKQEIDLDQLVDDEHSLADILGVSSGSTLIAVYSETIADNENTTRFSFIIQNPDGTLEPADMLNQVGGKTSDKTIYQTNRDGSEVEKLRVDSTYDIDSPLIDGGVLTARIGSMGYIEIGYGQVDRTSHRDAFTQELETERTRYTTKEVRDEFSKDNGMDNIVDKMDEIEKHEEYGCNDLSLDESDGDLSTGHIHDKAIEEIKAYDSSISDVFTDREIEDRLQKMYEEYPEDSFEEVVERTQRDLAEDASRMHSGPHGR